MITLHLEAESLSELKDKVLRALDMTLKDPVPLPEKEWKADPLEPIAAGPAPARPRRKHRATATPKPEPEPAEPVLEDVDLTSFDSEEAPGEASDGAEWLDYMAEDEPATVAPPRTPMANALANEKIKAEVIDRLAGLFNSGKVKFIRSILDEFGNGAKTFAEIDASQFPEIREAMNRGANG